MRFSAVMAFGVLALSCAARAQPPGPDSRTLAWWSVADRSGRQVAPWVRSEAADLAAPVASIFGESPTIEIVVRAALLGAAEGFGITGEIRAGEQAGDDAARCSWSRITTPDDAAAGRFLRAILGEAKSEAIEYSGIHAARADIGAGGPGVLYALDGPVLTIASAEDALARAFAPADEGADAEPLKDFVGLAAARSKARPDSPAGLTIYLAVNSLRHEFEESFTTGRGSRLLASWRLTNARGAALFLGAPRARPANAAMFIDADIAFSSRSDSLGVARSRSLTLDALSREQALAGVRGARTLLIIPQGPMTILDWGVKMYRATLAPDEDKAFTEAWRAYIYAKRPALADARESFSPMVVVDLSSAADAASTQPAISLRVRVRSGSVGSRASARLGELSQPVGGHSAGDDPAGPWSLPFALPWMRGRVAWAEQRTGDVSVIHGVVALGDTDPIAAIGIPPPEPIRP